MAAALSTEQPMKILVIKNPHRSGLWVEGTTTKTSKDLLNIYSKIM